MTVFASYRRGAAAYLLVSLSAFDVRRATLRGHACVFVGVDGLVKPGEQAPDLSMLLDHADFHAYHRQVNPSLWTRPPATALWIQVWQEGLAAYVAAKLNPQARLDDVLGAQDLAAQPAELKRWARQVLAAMETTDAAESRRFLDPAYAGDIPARTGYLVGYRLAEHAGRSLSLDQLAHLPARKVHGFMRKQLSLIVHG